MYNFNFTNIFCFFFSSIINTYHMVKNTRRTVSSKILVFLECYVSQGVLSICFKLTQSTQIKLFSRLLVYMITFKLVHVLLYNNFVCYFGTIIWDENIVYFFTEKKTLFVYIIFINKLSWYYPKIKYENIIQKDMNKFGVGNDYKRQDKKTKITGLRGCPELSIA